jgi:hypothetical protein
VTKISIPNSLRRICDDALRDSLQTLIRLHDDIESIVASAFATCTHSASADKEAG